MSEIENEIKRKKFNEINSRMDAIDSELKKNKKLIGKLIYKKQSKQYVSYFL